MIFSSVSIEVKLQRLIGRLCLTLFSTIWKQRTHVLRLFLEDVSKAFDNLGHQTAVC